VGSVRNLNYQLKQLCRNNRDGSFSTQSGRRAILQQVANDLRQLGFWELQARSLKKKHIDALVKKYKNDKLAVGTIKNRMSALRWWSQKFNREQVVEPTNAHYGIGTRDYVAKESKAQQLDQTQLNKITCPYVKPSLQLQIEFGLRREEAIKFMPRYADQRDHIKLKSTWCKGGKARTIPIRTHSQREVLNYAHQLAKRGALIPPQLQYVQQMRRYEKQCLKAELYNMHGLRHAYAQNRYEELTGWKAPACGGLTSKQLTAEQKQQDLKARLIISSELGHHREQITVNYLGR